MRLTARLRDCSNGDAPPSGGQYIREIIVDMQKEADEQSAEMVLAEAKAYELLNKLNADDSSLLIEHYIKGETMMEVSHKHHLALRYTKRKMASALNKFQILLEQHEKANLSGG